MVEPAQRARISSAPRAHRVRRTLCTASSIFVRRWRGRRCLLTCVCGPFPGLSGWIATHYRRTVAIALSQKGDACGWIAVSLAKSGMALDVEMSPSLAPVIGAVIVRVKHLFDLGASPDAVSALLSQDPMLARVVRRLPGLRVPGAFDGFELAVRAVLGQQVSVKAATTLAGRWAAHSANRGCNPISRISTGSRQAPADGGRRRRGPRGARGRRAAARAR